MSGTVVAARLARREVVRRPWRSFMVLLLVMLPVVVVTVVAVVVRTSDQDHAWKDVGRNWGMADLAADGIDAPSPPSGTLTFNGGRMVDLPEGSRVLEVREAHERLRSADGVRAPVTYTDLPFDDPIAEGMLDRLDGRLPTGPGEVLLAAPLARQLGVEAGDTLELDRPALTATVVGVAEWPASLQTPFFVSGPNPDAEIVSILDRSYSRTLLVDLPAEVESDPAVVLPLRDAGAGTRAFGGAFGELTGAGAMGADVAILWTWVGATVAFVIMGVVIAAAFAVSARRQLRLIGQLMGNGASRQTLQATLFLQGTVIGLVGGLLGIALGVGLTVVGRSAVEEHLFSRRIDGFDLRTADLVPILLIAVVAATVAAMLPARTAVRTTVMQALAGRRPVGPYPSRLVLRGAAATIVGLGLLVVATLGSSGSDSAVFVLTGIIGAVALILGTCAMAPAVIGRLEPLSARLGGTARLAARSVARQRVRTGAVVAAVAVVAAGAVAGSTAWATRFDERADFRSGASSDLVVIEYSRWQEPETHMEAYFVENYPAPVHVIADVLDIVPGAEITETRVATLPAAAVPDGRVDPGVISSFDVADRAYLDSWKASPEVEEALDRHGVVTAVWTEPGAPVVAGSTQLLVADPTFTETRTVEAAIAPWNSSKPLVTAEAAERLGLEISPDRTFVRSPVPLTAQQLRALAELSDNFNWDNEVSSPAPGDTVRNLALTHAAPPSRISSTLVTGGIISLATLLTLAVVGLGLALSAAETKDERDVLAVIGARPRTLRRLAGAKAAVLALIGTVIGVPLGFVPVYVVTRTFGAFTMTPAQLAFPWLQVGLLVVVVPAVAALATFAASAVTLRVRPVTASTMAFD